jgi:osmotically-inducible protein OsmY
VARFKQAGRRALIAVATSAALLLGAWSLQAQATKIDLQQDAVITHEVKRSILYHLLINTKTTTSNGIVTLSGKADSAAEKALNTRLATEVTGVKSVINNMVITSSP